MNATEISPLPATADRAPERLPSRVPSRIAPTHLAALLGEGRQLRLLDVRSPAEYDAQHVAGAVLQPLDALNPADWTGQNGGGPLYVFCQSGGRASRAAALLAQQGVDCCVVDGGLEAWAGAGLPVEKGVSKVLPLMRQVQLVVGLVGGVGAALAVWKHPLFALVPLFMSAGLVFAGATGYCGLALLLARMPWNRRTTAGGNLPTGQSASASCCAATGGNL
jgi:rhodanese-related sulfurtransferase